MAGPPDLEEIYESVEFFLDPDNYSEDIKNGFDLFKESYRGYRETGNLSGVWDHLRPDMVSIAEFMSEGNTFLRLSKVKDKPVDEALSYFEDLSKDAKDRL